MTGGAMADSPLLTRISSAYWSLIWHLRRMPERAVRLGFSPALLGWQYRRREPLRAYVGDGGSDVRGDIQTILPARRLQNPLPRNIRHRDRLSRDGALWGYSMWDVPERQCSATQIANLRDCRLQFFETPGKRDFFPALIAPDGRSIEAREISYRPGHAAQSTMRAVRRETATWIIERAYHNHSHWLTAHLPKLLLLRDRGELGQLVLPRRRTPVMDASMRMLDIEPDEFETFDMAAPLQVDRLSLVQTDRFDPVHMQAVRAAFAYAGAPAPSRKVFISRANSRGRKLLNEDALWPLLRNAGFERVLMEDLDFAAQVRLMQETRVLLAPHGAGLTNMLFCPAGGHVVEIADPGFPNPNFYALSCALDLDYWLVPARASKADHPLNRDLTVDLEDIARILPQLA